MNKVSLTELIDDILLIVRNNNISESEDFSRAQIAAWIKHYRKAIEEQKKDEIKDRLNSGQLSLDDILEDDVLSIKETGPLKLIDPTDEDIWPANTKRTEEPLKNIFLNNEASILAVHDRDGEVIQLMNHIRRHYNKFRRYTGAELTADYKDDGYIYVQGAQDDNQLRYIWVKAVYENVEDGSETSDGEDPNEEDITIPAWMVPPIKQNIMKNELAFMLNMPSDDSNNATLSSVKPHGPQDDEK